MIALMLEGAAERPESRSMLRVLGRVGRLGRCSVGTLTCDVGMFRVGLARFSEFRAAAGCRSSGWLLGP